jgi:predicted CopG family antitoxin
MTTGSETTMGLSKATREKLNKLKVHPRQSYEEVILILIEKTKKGV